MNETGKKEQVQEEKSVITGRNAVWEALKSGRGIECLYVQKPPYTGSLSRIVTEARAKGILIREAGRARLEELSEGGNHQGVAALVQAYGYSEVEEILAYAAGREEPPFLLLLESIQDPHNLGAILRTADACGVHGVLVSKRRAAGLTAAAVKTAAGACEYVRVAKIGNMVQTIEELKKEGIWVACADMEGDTACQVNLKGPIALVIGGEHEGVSRLVREKCDYVVKLPMKGHVNSLNASVAAGALMYEIVRQRDFT